MTFPAKCGLLAAMTGLVAAATVNATAAGNPDPRVCVFDKQALCGKASATSTLRRKLSGDGSLHWDGVIACRGLAGLLTYQCTYRNGNGAGTARVVFAPAPSFKPTVTVTPA